VRVHRLGGRAAVTGDGRARVLVSEPIAVAGVELLREHFDVDVGVEWSAAELAERIGAYDAILIRSATHITSELIARGERLKVIGRAGVGVNNVDVAAATKRGIVVANAPQSNVISAAEHTIALMLALARNVPQAHASLSSGRWERSALGGVELYEKTLGILGFGRIGQLVAARALGLGMRVVAFDPYVAADRYRELGVERAERSADVYAQADFLTIHLPVTAQTRDWLDAEAFALMKDGVRVLNVARGELLVEEALAGALRSGKVAGAALDVFRDEPVTDHPLLHDPRVIVTPHLGASTTEAQDRAGVQTAEQVVAALTGGVVATAVNIPAVGAEDMEALGPFLPLCEQLGAIAMALAEGSSVDRVEVELLGRIAERDTRLLAVAVLNGVLRGHTEEDVNYVNAPAMAQDRGIELVEIKQTVAHDFTDLVRVALVSGGVRERVTGTLLGRRHRPHLLEVWGQRFNMQVEPYLTVFRYRDQPGMIGRVGTVLGERGVNISSAAVGHSEAGAGDSAVMAVTTDSPVPREAVDEILAADGFWAGRTVALVR
jgi:D-3-phosphoglycerate dehydrogenase / 2-oxoglutarate reductase